MSPCWCFLLTFYTLMKLTGERVTCGMEGYKVWSSNGLLQVLLYMSDYQCLFKEGRCDVMIYPILVTWLDRDSFVWVSGEFFEDYLLSFHPYLAIELPSGVDLIIMGFINWDHICLWCSCSLSSLFPYGGLTKLPGPYRLRFGPCLLGLY